MAHIGMKYPVAAKWADGNKYTEGFVVAKAINFNGTPNKNDAELRLADINYANNNLKQYICSISDTKFEEAQKHCEIDLNKFVRRNLNEKDKLFGFDFEE